MTRRVTVFVVQHVGIGWLSMGSVTTAVEHGRSILDTSERIGLVPSVGDAHRFGKRTDAEALAERLNRREGHDRWKAQSWEAAVAA